MLSAQARARINEWQRGEGREAVLGISESAETGKWRGMEVTPGDISLETWLVR